MTKPWYESAFGSHYVDLYGHRNEADARRAIDFIRRTGAAAFDRGPALDLCCGAGRHSLEWLKHSSASVVGLDLSVPLLSDAAGSAQRLDRPFFPVRGDMRRLPLRDGAFRLVINLFTSFGYFDADSDNERVIEEVARILNPSGGRFVIDHINPPSLRSSLQGETTRRTQGGIEVRERRAIDDRRRRVEKWIEFEFEGKRRELFESVRFYEKEEMVRLCAHHHLRLEKAYGGFDASPLTDQAPRAVYVFRNQGI